MGTTKNRSAVKKPNIVSKILGNTKGESSHFEGVMINKKLVDALDKFEDKEHLGMILEEALEAIDIEKVASEYEREMKKIKDDSGA